LKRYLTDATTRGKVAIESNDFNNELAVDNERLRNEVKKLKNENEHLTTSVQKFNKGQYLQNELLMNTVIKTTRVVLDIILLCKRKLQINTRKNRLISLSNALSVEKKVILPTTAKPNHQIPCQST
jgi:hypothetical protein